MEPGRPSQEAQAAQDAVGQVRSQLDQVMAQAQAHTDDEEKAVSVKRCLATQIPACSYNAPEYVAAADYDARAVLAACGGESE